ncbi:MAG: hypothetical protein AB2693_26305 [Candidatus Thiodiazotropha sp.]
MLEEAKLYDFTIDDQTLNYNPKPKLLGVNLDEKLKFDRHIDQVERKALRSLDLLRRVKETEVISSKTCSCFTRVL